MNICVINFLRVSQEQANRRQKQVEPLLGVNETLLRT
jgi:hypothetical protein